MKILLTGGSGLVGRNIQDYAALNTDFTLLCPTSKELNLLDANEINSYIRINKPDIIIHAAGVVGGIQANIKNPVQFLADNAIMGQNIVLSAYQNGIEKLLNFGSSCMYPKDAANPLTEDLILTGALEPTNEGYALAKIMTAKLCTYISRINPKLSYKTLIPCNLYGRYDKFDSMKSHMIPASILKIDYAKTSNAPTVEIWGDGLARREFMYAEDLADATFFCLSKFEELPDMLNVGLGYDYSINEYYQAIADVVGFNGCFMHDLSKPTGMKQKLINTQKLVQLGWEHKFSLMQGIEKTYQYYLEQK